MSRRANIDAALRRRRALRVALGARRLRWRPYDRRGRMPSGIPSLVSDWEQFISAAHFWLTKYRSSAPQWWFSVEELAFDETGKYSVVVDHKDVLVYAGDFWNGFNGAFECLDRKAVCCG